MGDRTTVVLTITNQDYETHIEALDGEGDEMFPLSNCPCTELHYYGCNYAKLDFEDELRELSIPYDKTWEHGDEYPSGFESVRVWPNGKITHIEGSNCDENSLPLHEIESAYAQGKLQEVIESKKTQAYLISWELQSRIVAARQEALNELLAMPEDQLDAMVPTHAANEPQASEVLCKARSEKAKWLLANGYMNAELTVLNDEANQAFYNATQPADWRPANGSAVRHFKCELTEINGDYEYPAHFLMQVGANECPETRLEDIFTNYRGQGSKEGDEWVWYECGVAAKEPYMQELTPVEYEVLQKHLTIL